MRRSTSPELSTAGLCAALLLVGAALTADVVHHGLVRRLDWATHLAVDAHLHGAVVRLALHGLALVGHPRLLVAPLLVLATLSARRHGTSRPLVTAALVLAGTAGSVWLIKTGVGRVAPSSGHDRIHAAGISYPSGHAVSAVVCWGLLLEYAASLGGRLGAALPVRRRRLLTAVLAAAAGLGMTALDYHWLSDVIAGWLLGGLVLALVLAVGPVRRRVSRPLPADRRAREIQVARDAPEAQPEPARPVPSG